MTSIHVIIYGTVTFCVGGKPHRTVQVDANTGPILHTQIGLFKDNQTSTLTLKAEGSCHVFVISKDLIAQMLSTEPAIATEVTEKSLHRDERYSQLCRNVRSEYKPLLHLEMTCHEVRKSETFFDVESWEMCDFVLNSETEFLHTGYDVKHLTDIEAFKAIYVVTGEFDVLLSNEINSENENETFAPFNKLQRNDLNGAASAKGDDSLLMSGGAVMRTSDLMTRCDSVVARGDALILKLRKEKLDLKKHATKSIETV